MNNSLPQAILAQKMKTTKSFFVILHYKYHVMVKNISLCYPFNPLVPNIPPAYAIVISQMLYYKGIRVIRINPLVNG
jgi:hypothetical protein